MNNKLTDKQKAYIGLVKELPCSVCDAPGPSDAHHIDQDLQYCVVALCKSCHQNSKLGWHGEKRMWKIKKMDQLDALDITIKRLLEVISGIPLGERASELCDF
jgi:hypothetical protein